MSCEELSSKHQATTVITDSSNTNNNRNDTSNLNRNHLSNHTAVDNQAVKASRSLDSPNRSTLDPSRHVSYGQDSIYRLVALYKNPTFSLVHLDTRSLDHGSSGEELRKELAAAKERSGAAMAELSSGSRLSSCEPGSKVLIRGLCWDYHGSLFMGYQAV